MAGLLDKSLRIEETQIFVQLQNSVAAHIIPYSAERIESHDFETDSQDLPRSAEHKLTEIHQLSDHTNELPQRKTAQEQTEKSFIQKTMEVAHVPEDELTFFDMT